MADCLATYASAAGNCSIQSPEEGSVLAPWVTIQFVDFEFNGNGSVITVGNLSSNMTDPPNEAVIKSFEFGQTDGFAIRVVIHDQQGGSFEQFMQNLLKDWACLADGPANVLMQCQFGWVKSGCQTPFPANASPVYYAFVNSVEASLTEGKFIFEITGNDLCHRMFEGGAEITVGGEGQNAIHLTDAISQLMTNDVPPNIGKVSFKKVQGGIIVDSSESGVQLFDGITDAEKQNGPLGKWTGSGRTKLDIAIQWLSKNPTADGRSWIPRFNSTDPEGELIFWSDPRPKDVIGDEEITSNCLGTFIVNGGKDSSVIEFNPKIRWNFSALDSVGGNLAAERMNAMQDDGAKLPGLDVNGLDRNSQPGAGLRTQAVVGDGDKDRLGKEAPKHVALAQAEAKRALRITYNPIEADLVIVGNPTLLPPSEAIFKFVSIVLINPFYLTNASSSGCGDWLARPACNPVLSNKAWECKAVNHRIEAGVYTTTLRVYLAAPGSELPPGAPLGGWANGWQPPPQC